MAHRNVRSRSSSGTELQGSNAAMGLNSRSLRGSAHKKGYAPASTDDREHGVGAGDDDEESYEFNSSVHPLRPADASDNALDGSIHNDQRRRLGYSRTAPTQPSDLLSTARRWLLSTLSRARTGPLENQYVRYEDGVGYRGRSGSGGVIVLDGDSDEEEHSSHPALARHGREQAAPAGGTTDYRPPSIPLNATTKPPLPKDHIAETNGHPTGGGAVSSDTDTPSSSVSAGSGSKVSSAMAAASRALNARMQQRPLQQQHQQQPLTAAPAHGSAVAEHTQQASISVFEALDRATSIASDNMIHGRDTSQDMGEYKYGEDEKEEKKDIVAADSVRFGDPLGITTTTGTPPQLPAVASSFSQHEDNKESALEFDF